MTTANLDYAPRLSTAVWHQPADVLPESPLPVLGRIYNDEATLECVAYDDYGRAWWGGTPHEVRAAFAEDRARICENARKSGFTLEEMCDMIVAQCADANRPERPY
jgi:hypothetical protein